MIVEALVHLGLSIAGSALLGAAGLRSMLAHAALAIPAGAALFVGCATALVLLPVHYSPMRALLLAGAIAAVVVAQNVRAICSRGFFAWTAVVPLLSLALISVRGVRATFDSYEYLAVGGVLSMQGGLSEPAYLYLDRQLLLGVLHDLSSLYGGSYLAALSPLFAVSGACSIVWMHRAAGQAPLRSGWFGFLVLALVLVALGSANRTLFNAFYLNAHMMVGVYTLVVAGLCWLVAQRFVQARVLLVACVTIIALVVARPESSVMLLTVLIPACFLSRIEVGWRRAMVWTFAATSVAWWGAGLGPLVGFGVRSPAAPALVAAVGIALSFEVMEARPNIRGWRDRVVPAMHLVLWGAVGAGLLAGRGRLRQSVEATWANQVEGEGAWGATVVGMAVLVVLVSVWRRLDDRQILLLPLAAFLPLSLLLAEARGHPYLIGPTDSLNRMFLHVMLLAGFYISVALDSRTAGDRIESTP